MEESDLALVALAMARPTRSAAMLLLLFVSKVFLGASSLTQADGIDSIGQHTILSPAPPQLSLIYLHSVPSRLEDD